MASEVGICNAGLAMLGTSPILSLSDNSKSARNCNLIFDDKRDELLRDYAWKFATTRTNLAPETTTPAFEWSYQFAKPSDCIKLLFVGDTNGIRYSYSYEGNKILCNYNLIYVKYTKRVTDPNELDPLFRAALSSYLAMRLSNVLGARDEYTKCVEDFEEQLSKARFAGSIEDDDEEIEADDWLNSRL